MDNNEERLNELIENAPGVTRDKVEYVNRLIEDGTIKTQEDFLRFFGGKEDVAKRDYTAYLDGHGGSSRVREIMRDLSKEKTAESEETTEVQTTISDTDREALYNQASEDYQNLLELREETYNRLTDLGEVQGNAPQEDFIAQRSELNRIDDLIAEAGERMAKYAPGAEKTSAADEAVAVSDEEISVEPSENQTEQSQLPAQSEETIVDADRETLYSQAVEDYQNLLELREETYNRLTDLGEVQGNAPQEDFIAQRRELDRIDDLIAEAGERMAKYAPGAEKTSTDDEVIVVGEEDIIIEEPEKQVEQSQLPAQREEIIIDADYVEVAEDEKAKSITFTAEDTIDSTLAKLDQAVENNQMTREEADEALLKIDTALHLTEKNRINELLEENAKYSNDREANIQRKQELIDEAGAKTENLNGYDEAVRQLDAEITRNEEEIMRLQEIITSNNGDFILELNKATGEKAKEYQKTAETGMPRGVADSALANATDEEFEDYQRRNSALANATDEEFEDYQRRNSALANATDEEFEDYQRRNSALANATDEEFEDYQRRNSALANATDEEFEDYQRRNSALANATDEEFEDYQRRNSALANATNEEFEDYQRRNSALANATDEEFEDYQRRNSALANATDEESEDYQRRNSALANATDEEFEDYQRRNSALANATDEEFEDYQRRNSALANATDEEFEDYQRRNSALANATDEEFEAYQKRNSSSSNTTDGNGLTPRLPEPSKILGLPGPTSILGLPGPVAGNNENSNDQQNNENGNGQNNENSNGQQNNENGNGQNNENSNGQQNNGNESINTQSSHVVNVEQKNADINQVGNINQNGGINIVNAGNINVDRTNTTAQNLEETDPRNIEYQRIWNNVNREYEEAQARVQASITEMQRIFAEERRIRTEDGPFSTVQELDDFTAEYMRQKIEEDERLTNARTAVKIAENQMRAIERKMHDYATAKEEAAKLGIPVEEYERIRKSSAKREVLQNVYNQRGIGEVTRRTREGKEQADLTTEEIINMVVDRIRNGAAVSLNQDGTKVNQNGIINQNGAVNIVIIDSINFGTDTPVKLEGARTTTIKEVEKAKVKTKVDSVPRKVQRTGDEPVQTNPGPAPRDMVISTEADANTTINVDQTNANIDQDGAVNQNGGINIANIGNITVGGGNPSDSQPSDNGSTTDSETTNPVVEPDKKSDISSDNNNHDSNENKNDQEPEKKTNTQNDNNGSNEKENEQESDKKPKPRINPDGTYHLTKDEIIQDDLSIPDRKPSSKSDPRDDQESGLQKDPRDNQQDSDKDRDSSQSVGPEKGDGSKQTEEPEKDNNPKQPEEPEKGSTPGQQEPGKNPWEDPGYITEPTGGTKDPKESPKVKRGLLTIIDDLKDGLELDKKDGKRYTASNIKVWPGFIDELQSGNYLYNIVHLVPAIVKLPINFLRKASGKIMLGKQSKENIAKLQERINALNEEDLMTIYEEYRGSRVIQERFPTIINTLLEDRIQRFASEKVSNINSELEVRYQSVFSAIRQLESIDAKLANPSLDNATRAQLTNSRAAVFNGQAENISAIRKGYIDANGWLSGGSHGFSEDMKAAATKLSCVGKRFAKDHDLDGDLLHRQAQLEKIEMRAIAEGDNEKALRAFVESERILSENTEIKGSIFGKRSTGKKYYSPLVEQLDYHDDPFLRDLFTTIAVTSAAVSATKALQQAQNGGLTPEQAAAIKRNEAMMDQVNKYGQEIADKRGVMMDGMEAQSVQDTLNASGEVERAVLDSQNWHLGTKAYRAADDAGHSYYTDLYQSTEGAINAITSKCAQGAITQAEAIKLMSELSANSQATLQNVTQECLNILKPYAASHPQFNLTGVEAAMDYMVQNPTAIAEMNQAMVDVTAIGDTLSQMQLEHIAALQTIPSNVKSYFLTCASSAALAANVANTAQGAKNHTYGNNVTDMVEEYVADTQAAQTAQQTAGRGK